MAGSLKRIGVLRNPRSHGNQGAEPDPPKGVLWAEPDDVHDHAEHLAEFAAQGIELLVIAGGDGTVREVLSAMAAVYGDAPQPVIAVQPAGKTNILALDLGAPPSWTLQAILGKAAADEPVVKSRFPIQAVWADGAHRPVTGFFFGMGAAVKATEMAQKVHRRGAFHNLAVGLSVSGAIAGTFCGGDRDQWRRGVELTLAVDDGPVIAGPRFLTMATTLKRLPMGLKPFGPPRDGLKVLDIDAPPHRLFRALPAVAQGRSPPWFEDAGYRRHDAEQLAIRIEEQLVIDGEVFVGGEIVVRRGAPVRFLAP